MIKRLALLAALTLAGPASATIFIDGGSYEDYKKIVIPFALSRAGYQIYFYENLAGNDWKIVYVGAWGADGIVVWCSGPGRLPPNFKTDYAGQPIVQLTDMTSFPKGWSSGNSTPTPAPTITTTP